MASEIERRFLLIKNGIDLIEKQLTGPVVIEQIVQGYVNASGMTTRVRVVDEKFGFLTLKGPKPKNLDRKEYEYPIPFEEAMELLDMCGKRIVRKRRIHVPHNQRVWHVDAYRGSLKGFFTAEIEFPDHKKVSLTADETPIWLGREITFVKGLSNRKLATSQKIPKIR